MLRNRILGSPQNAQEISQEEYMSTDEAMTEFALNFRDGLSKSMGINPELINITKIKSFLKDMTFKTTKPSAHRFGLQVPSKPEQTSLGRNLGRILKPHSQNVSQKKLFKKRK